MAQAGPTNTTRRKLFAGALGVAAAASAPQLASASPLADQWRLARQLQATCDAYEGTRWDDFPQELEAMEAAEWAVIDGSIRSREDAVAKLSAAGYFAIEAGFEITPRVEGAYADAVRYLEAH